jgi:hypothetical protein
MGRWLFAETAFRRLLAGPNERALEGERRLEGPAPTPGMDGSSIRPGGGTVASMRMGD